MWTAVAMQMTNRALPKAEASIHGFFNSNPHLIFLWSFLRISPRMIGYLIINYGFVRESKCTLAPHGLNVDIAIEILGSCRDIRPLFHLEAACIQCGRYTAM